MSDNEISEYFQSIPDVSPDVERLEIGCETVNREPYGECPPGTVRLGKWPNADGSYTLSIWYRPEGWSIDFLGIH